MRYCVKDVGIGGVKVLFWLDPLLVRDKLGAGEAPTSK